MKKSPNVTSEFIIINIYIELLNQLMTNQYNKSCSYMTNLSNVYN